MRELMDWNECMRKYVKKVEADAEKVRSLLRMTQIRERTIHMIKRDNETISVLTEDYYEIIKELLVGLMLLHGMKSDNHECLISFFKRNYSEYEYEANIIYQLKLVRNRIDYEGFLVPSQYFGNNESEFKHIIKLLRELIEKKLDEL